MSLPKEPRQKMINIMYLVLTALLAINISAEILNAFKTINNSLEKTNGQVAISTNQVMKSLSDKANDPKTAEKANEWKPKAEGVMTEAQKAIAFIEGLKKQLIEASTTGGTMKDDEQNATTRILVKEGKGAELKKILEAYKKGTLDLDPKIKTEFEKGFQVDTEMPKDMVSKKKSWEEAYFYMSPTIGALSILSKFQNDIRTSENKMVTFCHEQVGKVEVVFDAYSVLVGQSSNYVMPGQTISVNAGIGAYSKSSTGTSISIGGSSVPLTDGVAVKEITAGGAGTYSIPVRISYINQSTGKQEEQVKNIEYTVGTPGGASVGLDKMNVFYVGVDNPITVASSTGWDKTKVSIAGGGGALVSAGGAGKYNVRVSSVTDDCSITVTADGKPSTFKYRVRTVPGAAAYVGGAPSGDNIPASTFKAQGGVGAGIKDFPFDLKYTVASFLISTDSDDGDIIEAAVQGNTFSGNAQNVLRQVKPGKTVYIDNIRVIGPDGQNKKVPSLVYYIK
jgi:gliding motility-associated protein GldM